MVSFSKSYFSPFRLSFVLKNHLLSENMEDEQTRNLLFVFENFFIQLKNLEFLPSFRVVFVF